MPGRTAPPGCPGNCRARLGWGGVPGGSSGGGGGSWKTETRVPDCARPWRLQRELQETGVRCSAEAPMCPRLGVIETRYNQQRARGPEQVPGPKAVDLALAVSICSPSLLSFPVGLCPPFLSSLGLAPTSAPQGLPLPSLPRAAGARRGARLRLALTNSRNPPRHAADGGRLLTLKSGQTKRNPLGEVRWGTAVPVKPVCSQLSLSFKKIIKANR